MPLLLPALLFPHLPAHLIAHLPVHLPVHLPASLLTHLCALLPPHLPAHLRLVPGSSQWGAGEIPLRGKSTSNLHNSLVSFGEFDTPNTSRKAVSVLGNEFSIIS